MCYCRLSLLFWWRHNILVMMPDNLPNSYTLQFVKWGVLHTTEGLKKEYEQEPSWQIYQNKNRLCKSRKLHVVHVCFFCSNTPTNLKLICLIKSVHFTWFWYFNIEIRYVLGDIKYEKSSTEWLKIKKKRNIMEIALPKYSKSISYQF